MQSKIRGGGRLTDVDVVLSRTNSSANKAMMGRGFLPPLVFHRFAMPHQPLRKLRSELFEPERNIFDAFLTGNETEIQQHEEQVPNEVSLLSFATNLGNFQFLCCCVAFLGAKKKDKFHAHNFATIFSLKFKCKCKRARLVTLKQIIVQFPPLSQAGRRA